MVSGRLCGYMSCVRTLREHTRQRHDTVARGARYVSIPIRPRAAFLSGISIALSARAEFFSTAASPSRDGAAKPPIRVRPAGPATEGRRSKCSRSSSGPVRSANRRILTRQMMSRDGHHGGEVKGRGRPLVGDLGPERTRAPTRARERPQGVALNRNTPTGQPTAPAASDPQTL